ncbi:histidine--tRNA ligase [Oryzicola mucosus]|uniref:Histidine--tRNA ligase n=1 Tax=Oryzicola mucosus TaxID=2767425 RepID=A0A8J6PSB0_9HYPH|nr:HisS family protein [Oryzicola mucosus]MBD0413056.1 histidine--tRNA ligase family protein [Oryzicola mucosus]
MADKTEKMKARLPRGFVDRMPGDIRAAETMMSKIREVYELYGFEPADQPLIEYTDALGKFLPDQDRPNEGVFSFQDDDEQWLSLRYDLTAPMARFVAENFERLPKPFRSYRSGWVFRNEKPGPGRFRQFMQFDADTVGTPGVAADAEMCMMMADVMEALGIKRGEYVIRVNNRKLIDGIMDSVGVPAAKRLDVLRAIDKRDRLGAEGVRQLLSKGRVDDSGDFTKGAELPTEQVEAIISFVEAGDLEQRRERIRDLITASTLAASDLSSLFARKWNLDIEETRKRIGLDDAQIDSLFGFIFGFPFGYHQPGTSHRETWEDDLVIRTRFGSDDYRLRIDNALTVQRYRSQFGDNPLVSQALDELEQIASLSEASKYGSGRILIDPSVVRGLEYYTGPVYEAELLAEIPNDEGQIVRFGSVGGGGRYDGLVSRFRGEPVPATGFSIGVSRLMTALKNLGKLDTSDVVGPVVVLVMDRDTESLGGYQKMVSQLRQAGIRAEMYLGGSGMKPQMKYADRRGAPVVVIQGGDERNAVDESGNPRPMVQIKDMVAGAEIAAGIADNAEYKEARPGQVTVPQADLVATVRGILDAQAAEKSGG